MSRRKGTKNTDHAGQRYGRLVIVSKSKQKQAGTGTLLWTAKCDCGSEKLVNATDAMRGKVKSCGCELMRRASLGPAVLAEIQAAGDEFQELPHGLVGEEISRIAQKFGVAHRVVSAVVYGKSYRHTGIGGYRGVAKPRGKKSMKMLPQWGAHGD